MPSTYTTNGGIELPANGEQSGTWGETVNDNMAIIDRLTNGVGEISLSGTTHTLTTTDGTLSDGQYNVLVLGGSPSGTNTITISPNDGEHVYVVKNASGQTATFTQGSGANVSVINNTTKIIYADGAGAGAAVVDITGALDLGSLIIAGTTTITAVLDEDNMASDSATALATQQSIKAYVDAQVGTVDTLAEILANGNTTGGTDIVVSVDDVISMDNGTNLLPSLTTTGDLNTGLYFPAADEVGLTVGGTQRLKVSATGVDITGTLNAGNATFSSTFPLITGVDTDVSSRIFTIGGQNGNCIIDVDPAGTAGGSLFQVDVDNGEVLKLTSAGAYVTGLLDVSTNAVIDGTALVTGVLTTTAATVSNGGGQFNGAINVGVDDTGYDVKFFGATTGKSLLWDESADSLIVTGTTTLVGTTNLDAVDIDGATQIDATVTVGVDDTGYDVKFFGATAGAYMLWDESADTLEVSGTITVDGLTVDGSVSITDAVNAKLSLSGPISSIDMYDTSSVNSNTRFESHSNGLFIKSLNDDGTATQYIIELNCSNGNIIFFDDTSTEGVHWNAATKRLGIGTAAADTALDVTGTITADGLTVDGDTVTANAQNAVTVEFNNATGIISADRTGGNYAGLSLRTTAGSTPLERLAVAYNGDISFYEATGTTPKFFWDASDERLSLTGSDYQFGIQQGANQPWYHRAISNGKYLLHLNGTGDIMTLDTSGNVGIGFTSPSTRLFVSGGVNGAHATFSGQASRGLVISTANTLSNDDGVIYNAQMAGSGKHIFQTAGTEHMRIDSSGNVGIGTTSPSNKFVVAEATGQHGVEIAPGTTSYIQAYDRATSDYGDLRIDAQTIAFATDNGSERMRIDSSGNVGIGTSSPVEKLDVVGNIKASGTATVGGIYNSSLYNQSVGNIAFWVTNVGEACTIQQNTGHVEVTTGNLIIGTAGKGIDFDPAGGGAANLLDDYEEGTFEPTVRGSTTVGSATYTVQQGSYTKIGNVVYWQVRLAYTGHTGTGNMQIPFPFTSSNRYAAGNYSYRDALTVPASEDLKVYIPPSATYIGLYSVALGTDSVVALVLDTAVTDLSISGVCTVV